MTKPTGIKANIALKWRRLRSLFRNLFHRWDNVIHDTANILTLFSTVGALACIVCLVIHVGYEHSEQEYLTLSRIFRSIQWVFGATVIFSLTFDLRDTVRKSRWLRWTIDIAVLCSLLPVIYPRPDHPWIPWLDHILYSNTFLFSVLLAYSIVTLSYTLFRIVDQRTNPSLLLSMSFLVFIILGSFMLMLPKSTYGGIGFTDAFFVSTSAVCVTGLTPVDIPAVFTPLGLSVLALLIQFGALGVMTFTSFFALFFSGSASIYSQLVLRDVIYSKSMNSLIPTLLYILAFTITVELIGAALIFASIHNTLGFSLRQELVFSAFHSLSAFCNAGFSNLPGGLSNPVLLNGNISIYWIMTLLIVAGSIGFPILVNTKDAVVAFMKQFFSRRRGKAVQRRALHQFNMNTKIVLFTFLLLLGVGAVLFFVLEYSNSLKGLPLAEKITQAVFNSAVPRSAGFSSVNPDGFLNVTLVMILFLMWVGGGSQSTGGGIKVNTLAAIWLNLRAIVTGAPRVTAYKRTIATGSIRRANAVVAISILSYTLLSFLLLGIEHDLPARAVLFESCSALFTVGSSLGITGQLCDTSKFLLCIAMFLGRVGIISLLIGVVKSSAGSRAEYPSDNIIIN